MHRVRALCLALLACAIVGSLGSLGSLGCSGGRSSNCSAGSERCPCYANDTCNAGLVCLSMVCVSPGRGGSTGTGGGATGGTSTTGGTTGAGGLASGGRGGAGGAIGAAGASGGQGGSGGVAGTTGATGRGGTTGAAGTTGLAGAGGTNCGQATLSPARPDILIVQDRSGSMNEDPSGQQCTGGCGANSKWYLTYTAIDTVLGMTDTTINWGVKFFPTTSTCSVSTTVEVPIGPGNATVINTAFGQGLVGGSTPTRVAIQNSVAYLQTLTGNNPKFLLLATDGLPTCMPGSTATTTDDSAGAIQAIADALSAGYPTFVVGIGNTMGAVTLDSMAIAGGRPQLGAATSYYQTSNTADLVAALGQIVGSAGSAPSCVFELGNPSNSRASNAAIDVFGDLNHIPRDLTHVNGWDYSMGTSQITIYGPPCQSIKAGAITTVSNTYVCVVQ